MNASPIESKHLKPDTSVISSVDFSGCADLCGDNVFYKKNTFVEDTVLSGPTECYGTIDFLSNDLKLQAGNFIQTFNDTNSMSSNVMCYSSRTAFIQAECPNKYYGSFGPASTGVLGYKVLSIYTTAGGLPSTLTSAPSGEIVIDVLDTSLVSGDGGLSSKLSTFLNTADKAKCKWSLTIGDFGRSSFLTLSSVKQKGTIEYDSENKLSSVTQTLAFAEKLADYDSLLKCLRDSNGNKTYDAAWFDEQWADYANDNGLYCPLCAEAGCSIVPSFYSQHIEGTATRAIQRCTHAEGRRNIADIRYSHVEGSDNRALAMWSHAEGNNNSTDGHSSHVEGSFNMLSANATNAHVEGSYNKSYGDSSHTEGLSCQTRGRGSHTEGTLNYAICNYGHAGGDGYCYAGANAFYIISASNGLSNGESLTGGTIQLNTLDYIDENGSMKNLADVSSTLSADSKKPFNDVVTIYFRVGYAGVETGLSTMFNVRLKSVNKTNKTISVDYLPQFKHFATAGSYKTNDPVVFFMMHPVIGDHPIGDGAFAQGYDSLAMEDGFAVGDGNKSVGRYAVATGVRNVANYMATAIGVGNSALGAKSIAMGGWADTSLSSYSTGAVVKAERAFGWTGQISAYEVPSTRTGTFNIDPINGVEGFYIGNQSLKQIIESNVPSTPSTATTLTLELADGTTKKISVLSAEA